MGSDFDSLDAVELAMALEEAGVPPEDWERVLSEVFGDENSPQSGVRAPRPSRPPTLRGGAAAKL